MQGWLIGVLGNVAGDATTATLLFFTRHLWMPHWTAFVHKHKEAHLLRLAEALREDSPGEHE